MKRLFLLLLISLNIAVVSSQGALSIQVKDLNGNVATITDVTDSEFVVLDFWATWCKPCIKSIPKLVKLSEKYDSTKLSFVGINVDSPRNINKIKPTVNALKITYPILHDPDQEISTELMVSALPTLVVLNQKGKVLFFHEGFVSGDEIYIEKELNKIISKK